MNADDILALVLAHPRGCSCSRCRFGAAAGSPSRSCSCGAEHHELHRDTFFNTEAAEFAEDELAWEDIECPD